MGSRVRVWLNRTYAENVFFMDQLRSNPQLRPVEIHATHGDPDSPVLAAADTAAMEPEGLSPAAYVEYALDQCARHSVDVFVPVLHQAAIVAHRAEFTALGTALLAPPSEAVAVFQDKATAYQAVQAVGVPVPPWWRVRTEEELVAAVEALEAEGHKACFKPAAGAGGVGFRVITRAPFSLAHLNGFPSPYVPLDLVVEALRTADEAVDWLVMPLLGQPEVSVDCLTAPDGRVRMAVGRTKNGRRRGFTLHPSFIEPARLLAEAFGLHYLTNIQFRMFGDDPVLMDVNTRPAGGLHQLSQCGINAPWAAVQLALGEEPGEMVPPLLGQDYTVLAGPRPVRPVSLPQQRTETPASTLPAVPAPASEPVPAHAPKASNAATAAIAPA
ncbi:ATP-grasp domain-containing protein [Streptomyces sp. NBC_01340]|uniref:ATP-grasp domain-containing protein n=1 Tax=unclassified Streptomyces TaxID=2593676 RepID=UPI0022547F06|nr:MULTISPECIES: ATP-grasp domain-containing protein [unclassified Streptomyces]MCX4458413.1 ATP-grasp domain-containing protein [Streptomyces sp. NBC_01719]MCX4497770.1 ATP-grasp domain-containing protein [Streptomyces sp. NBC_01728]WSI42584.1 ATP-grasp domain-containing protein [Streptomyces sp. NBC_01340]